jgi:hypothetical protein
LAPPAFAPTPTNGLRPLREALAGRAEVLALREVVEDLLAVCVLLAWPDGLRAPQEGVEELLERGSGRPLLFAPLPLPRLPLLAEAPACAPLRFPLESAAALGVQRAAEAERPLLVARASAGRESEAPRRAGRLAEEACAGLRSRE